MERNGGIKSFKIVFGNASAAAVNEKAILHLFG
jgi:hypothetical protein